MYLMTGALPARPNVEATQLKKMLGLTSVNYTETNHTLAVGLYTRVSESRSMIPLG